MHTVKIHRLSTCSRENAVSNEHHCTVCFIRLEILLLERRARSYLYNFIFLHYLSTFSRLFCEQIWYSKMKTLKQFMFVNVNGCEGLNMKIVMN